MSDLPEDVQQRIDRAVSIKNDIIAAAWNGDTNGIVTTARDLNDHPQLSAMVLFSLAQALGVAVRRLTPPGNSEGMYALDPASGEHSPEVRHVGQMATAAANHDFDTLSALACVAVGNGPDYYREVLNEMCRTIRQIAVSEMNG